MIQLILSCTVPSPIASLRSIILSNSRPVILLTWAYRCGAMVFGQYFSTDHAISTLHYYTVELRVTDNPLILPPCYYSHFILAQTKAQSVINFLIKKPF